MCKVRKLSGFIEIFITLFVIDQILATNFYGIHERYPISVRKYGHGPNVRNGLKRTARNNGFSHISPKYNHSHDLLNDEGIKQNSPDHRSCVKCPGEITAIARRGLDGILVELPAPLSCKTNLPFASNLYRLETLFGSDFPFILPEGGHSLMAKVRNVESGLIVRSCRLRYHVIVRRCQSYPVLKNKNMKISCTAGTIWGSQCAFECKNDNENPSHREAIVCNEDLEWIGDEPDCVADIDNTLSYMRDEESCSQPEPPANGRFICNTRNTELDNNERQLNANIVDAYKTLSSGSVCHVQCNRSYSIPYHLYQFSTIHCINGAWNATDIEFCYKKEPKRRHSSRLRANRKSQSHRGLHTVQNHLDNRTMSN